MSPGRILEPVVSWISPDASDEQYAYDGPPRNVAHIESLAFPPELKPKEYHIEGTSPESQILFCDVNILEATGRLPYRGDVLIKGMNLDAQIGSPIAEDKQESESCPWATFPAKTHCLKIPPSGSSMGEDGP